MRDAQVLLLLKGEMKPSQGLRTPLDLFRDVSSKSPIAANLAHFFGTADRLFFFFF
jgi:hypothetical protein